MYVWEQEWDWTRPQREGRKGSEVSRYRALQRFFGFVLFFVKGNRIEIILLFRCLLLLLLFSFSFVLEQEYQSVFAGEGCSWVGERRPSQVHRCRDGPLKGAWLFTHRNRKETNVCRRR